MSRTLNEVHKCVLPKEDEFRVFKTAEEIAVGKIQSGYGAAVEIEDPRRNPTKFLKNSHEYIKDYGYSTELNASEQRTIMNSIQLTITHNPSLLSTNHNKQKRFKQLTLTPELIAKHHTELTHFNKCAEIFFYRNVGEINNLVSGNMKKFLVDRWKKVEDEHAENYHVITMLLRDQEGEIELELVKSEEEKFDKEIYKLSEENFLSIDKIAAEDLNFYCKLKDVEKEFKNDPDYDIQTPFDTLAKLFVDTEEFSVKFLNESNSRGKVFSSFSSALPLKNVPITESLHEIARTSVFMELDWANMSKVTKPQDSENQSSSEFKAELMNNVMQNIYKAYKHEAGNNRVNNIWKFAKDLQNFNVSVEYSDVFYSSTQVPANISIKLEYQTKFGAERMTRDELLKEWSRMKFYPTSLTFRYRIDAKTFKILSISTVNIQDVENELVNLHNTQPNLLLLQLVNVFGCIKRLPENNYLIQAKLEKGCKKLFIYKASDEGKSFKDEPFEVSSAFTRKWISIDESTPTFIHVKHNFAPGCFPAVNRGLTSYTKKPQKNNNKKKPAVEPKLNIKKATVIKKNLRKTEKRKKKMLMNLRSQQ